MDLQMLTQSAPTPEPLGHRRNRSGLDNPLSQFRRIGRKVVYLGDMANNLLMSETCHAASLLRPFKGELDALHDPVSFSEDLDDLLVVANVIP